MSEIHQRSSLSEITWKHMIYNHHMHVPEGNCQRVASFSLFVSLAIIVSFTSRIMQVNQWAMYPKINPLSVDWREFDIKVSGVAIDDSILSSFVSLSYQPTTRHLAWTAVRQPKQTSHQTVWELVKDSRTRQQINILGQNYGNSKSRLVASY